MTLPLYDRCSALNKQNGERYVSIIRNLTFKVVCWFTDVTIGREKVTNNYLAALN